MYIGAQKYKQLSEFLSSYYGIKIKVVDLKRLIGRADGETILAENWLADLSDISWDRLKESDNAAAIDDFLVTFRSYDAETITMAKDRLAKLSRKKPQLVAPPHDPGRRFRECGDCPEMIVLPSGEFQMGSPASEPGHKDHEAPQQRVTILRAFAAGRFEVTVGQFRTFVKETGHNMGKECWGVLNRAANENRWGYLPGNSFDKTGYRQTDDHPVSCVSWDDANAYIQWLNGRTSGGYRLLSEAEWEYAARAGTNTAFSFGDDLSQLCLYGNGADRSGRFKHRPFNKWCFDGRGWETAATGSYRPNAFGLRDMHGNLQEWVADCYHNSYENMPQETRATGAPWSSPGCAERVIRSGCWWYPPEGLRSAKRENWKSFYRSYCVGFRVAKSLPPENPETDRAQ